MMQVLDTRKLALLLEIAERAVIADSHRINLKVEADFLSEAYRRWKAENGIGHIDAGSPDWNRMMTATADQYQMVETAKREERNARKRLEGSIARYRRTVGIFGSEVSLSLQTA